MFSQMKDTKHIRRDFHSAPWVMPQGWDFEALGVPRGPKNFFFQTWSCGISNRRGWRAEQNASKIFILGSNWWPWGEVKGQISFNFGYHVNFKDFYTKFCVFSQMRDTKHIRQDFYSVVWVMPQGWDFGALGVPRGSNNFFFKHGHVAYQIDGDDEQNKMHITFSS